MEKGENLSFSKEVAETLGLECAIILNLFKEIESSDISSQDRLLAYAVNALPFIGPLKIKKSIDSSRNTSKYQKNTAFLKTYSNSIFFIEITRIS